MSKGRMTHKVYRKSDGEIWSLHNSMEGAYRYWQQVEKLHKPGAFDFAALARPFHVEGLEP